MFETIERRVPPFSRLLVPLEVVSRNPPTPKEGHRDSLSGWKTLTDSGGRPVSYEGMWDFLLLYRDVRLERTELGRSVADCWVAAQRSHSRG